MSILTTVRARTENARISTEKPERIVKLRVGENGKVHRLTLEQYLYRLNAATITQGSTRWREHITLLNAIAGSNAIEFNLTLTPMYVDSQGRNTQYEPVEVTP